ncbi:hypothetical protein EJ08DRAFT_734143 [Tothia fuscella]|uniref:FUN14 family protein n=1 Tax=Tothia fuscella TaxID=1048955 RepID=A0A9P4TY98_9PEZI|nr:hypothetical protein EJ08DRAFT_734143 [Tothia fuscella]
MASRLLFRPLSPFVFTSTLCACPLIIAPLIIRRRPILMDTLQKPLGGGSSFSQYKSDSKTPVVKDGRMNPNAVKQISSGSILGLVGGVAVSMFSKPLALLIGLLVFGVQFLESKAGVHLIPYQKLQGVFKNIDVKSAVQDNVAFKMSFGITFALAAFAKF